MKFPKITPVIAIGSLVIVVGLVILIVLSPIPWMWYSFSYSFLHQQDPDAVCFAPPADERTLNQLWDKIVNRSGIDSTSAAFDDLQIRLAPDGTIENVALSFYAIKDRKWGSYQAYLRYDPDTCGTLRIQSYPAEPPAYATTNPRSPKEILAELPTINLSAFGFSGQPVFIMTDVSREVNVTYYSLPCSDIFLLKNGTIVPVDRVVRHDTEADASHWTIFSERCIGIPGYGQDCMGGSDTIVFSADRMGNAEIVPSATGITRPLKLHECPRGPVEGQSYAKTLWGTSCVNWTINVPDECPHCLIQGQSCNSSFWGGTTCTNWTVNGTQD
jgi:hypothetical protein